MTELEPTIEQLQTRLDRYSSQLGQLRSQHQSLDAENLKAGLGPVRYNYTGLDGVPLVRVMRQAIQRRTRLEQLILPTLELKKTQTERAIAEHPLLQRLREDLEFIRTNPHAQPWEKEVAESLAARYNVVKAAPVETPPAEPEPARRQSSRREKQNFSYTIEGEEITGLVAGELALLQHLDQARKAGHPDLVVTLFNDLFGGRRAATPERDGDTRLSAAAARLRAKLVAQTNWTISKNDTRRLKDNHSYNLILNPDKVQAELPEKKSRKSPATPLITERATAIDQQTFTLPSGEVLNKLHPRERSTLEACLSCNLDRPGSIELIAKSVYQQEIAAGLSIDGAISKIKHFYYIAKQILGQHGFRYTLITDFPRDPKTGKVPFRFYWQRPEGSAVQVPEAPALTDNLAEIQKLVDTGVLNPEYLNIAQAAQKRLAQEELAVIPMEKFIADAQEYFESKAAGRPVLTTQPAPSIEATRARLQRLEPAVIAYEIPVEERLTEEEHRLLKSLTPMLGSQGRVDIYALFRELFPFMRRELTPTGDTKLYAYNAFELQKRFTSAYTKLDKDFQIPLRQKLLSNEDQGLWHQLQQMVEATPSKTPADFLRQVRRRLDLAWAEFSSQLGGSRQLPYIILPRRGSHG